jgi:hypothetical protein
MGRAAPALCATLAIAWVGAIGCTISRDVPIERFLCPETGAPCEASIRDAASSESAPARDAGALDAAQGEGGATEASTGDGGA